MIRLVLFCFAHFPLLLLGQPDTASISTIARPEVSNIIGLAKPGTRVVNGWTIALNLDSDTINLKTNGLYTHLNPSTLVFLVFGIPQVVVGPFGLYVNKDAEPGFSDVTVRRLKGSDLYNRVNGITLFPFGFSLGEKSRTNGLAIAPVSYSAFQTNGISLSILLNNNWHMNGVSISGLHNVSEKTQGVQVAIFNQTEELSGVQIGLLNRVGSRILPFVNIGFGKNKKEDRSHD